MTVRTGRKYTVVRQLPAFQSVRWEDKAEKKKKVGQHRVAKQPWNGTEEAASGQWELVGKGEGQLQTMCRRTAVASKIERTRGIRSVMAQDLICLQNRQIKVMGKDGPWE